MVHGRGAAAGLLLAGVLAACSSSAGDRGDPGLVQPVPRHVTVTTRHLPHLGTVLVDGSGRTLYMFPPDAKSRVTCTGPCAGTWPPLAVADGARPTAGAGVTRSDLSTLPDPNTGARIVTYAGFPLYRYAGDVRAGTANGQALFLNGGPWYVLTPGGQAVTTPGVDR